jgi:hypothetical protein
MSFPIQNPLLKLQTKTNSVALFHKQNIPTEQPPLVGEVSANKVVT